MYFHELSVAAIDVFANGLNSSNKADLLPWQGFYRSQPLANSRNIAWKRLV